MVALLPIARLAWTLLRSRTGLIVMAGLALYTWHTLDKSSAVRRAAEELVAGQRLATLRAEKAERDRRLAVYQQSYETLSASLLEARESEKQRDAEIETYVKEHPDSCGVVPVGLLKRLRNR